MFPFLVNKKDKIGFLACYATQIKRTSPSQNVSFVQKHSVLLVIEQILVLVRVYVS